MYAHRSTKRLDGLTVQIDLPPEFADCKEAEIIVLPLGRRLPSAAQWGERVRQLGGTLGADFPNDIGDTDLAPDIRSSTTRRPSAAARPGLTLHGAARRSVPTICKLPRSPFGMA